MKPSSRGLRSTMTTRTNEPRRWTNAARPVLDFSDNEAGRTCNDDAANAHFDDRHAGLRDDVRCHERCARPDPAQGDGLPGPVQLPDLRGPTQKSVRQARSRDRALEHAELRRAARRAGKGDHQIAHAAVDNAVAMVELAKADVAIVTGGDNGFNRIFVQPEINAYAEL